MLGLSSAAEIDENALLNFPDLLAFNCFACTLSIRAMMHGGLCFEARVCRSLLARAIKAGGSLSRWREKEFAGTGFSRGEHL
jgi:hypothetical protein